MDRTTRTRRDWFVDSAMFVLALAFGLFTAVTSGKAPPPPELVWLHRLDELAGLLGCGALWFRRRWPVRIAAVLVLLNIVSDLAAGAMLVSLFVVAVHQPLRTTMLMAGLSLAASVTQALVQPEQGLPMVASLVISVFALSMVIGWGLFVHRHRQLVERIRAEAGLRAEGARREAQESVAREMHDVLGHRLSLLSVHAGALEYRRDAPPEEVAQAAKVIRESAHQALQDLREVIGVLRAPVGELPQPTLADIRQLVSESVEAGMTVVLVEDIGGEPSDQLGRTAYRIVQEALTNARKHAPGAPAEVRLTGQPGQGLDVVVDNGEATGTPVVPAKPGQGLIGLGERVSLAEGTLWHGPAERAGWQLSAWLPWPP